MRFLGIFLLLCLAMAAARLAIVALTMTFLISLLWGALTRPAQAFGFMAMLIFMKLADAYPAILLVVLLLVAVGTWRENQL